VVAKTTNFAADRVHRRVMVGEPQASFAPSILFTTDQTKRAQTKQPPALSLKNPAEVFTT
jgi:hypothetical protein